MGRFIDLAGQHFGRLTVVSRGPNQGMQPRWWCSCSCGAASVLVRSDYLRSSHTQSCGCLRRELVSERSTTHGHLAGGKNTRSYRIWKNMKDRCHNPNNAGYPNYGGRGIKVCQRWQDSFEAFLEDMGEPPKGYTLDRIDNSLGYSKDNCRWATQRQQQNNRRNNRIVTVSGVEDTLANHCRRYGVKYNTVYTRLRSGWSTDRALSTPTATAFRN